MPIPCASPEDFSSILLEIVFGQLSFTVVLSANKGKYSNILMTTIFAIPPHSIDCELAKVARTRAGQRKFH